MQITILIVDDVKANLFSLRALLHNINDTFNIIEANNGEEALEQTINNSIDLVILDIQMPIMDGFEVAHFLKSNNLTKDIPIIFLTAAFKSNEFIEKGFKLGAVDYLTKPIDEYQFTNRITLYTKLFNQTKENRKKDQLMFQQSKMASMGDMLANIAHQWRQPLSCISTAASGLKLRKELGVLTEKEIEKDLTHIVNLTQHLSKTIDDFRTFFRQEKDKVEFKLSDALNKSLSIVEILFEYEGIEFEVSCEDLTLYSYENELIQVFLTILNNSKDAMSGELTPRIIFINTHIKDEQLEIKIRDNAGGVPTDIIHNIFEPYFTTKHESQGTGIGLYISNEIIGKHMKGTINVRNVEFEYKKNHYIGAEFIINIPIIPKL